MDIITFAKLHGILIHRLIEDGQWHRVPTEDKPRKRNGAYMSRGAYGFIQDHAVHDEPILWKPDTTEIAQVDYEAVQRQIQEAAERVRQKQIKAAEKAGWIMKQTELRVGHPYLVAKGFPDEPAPIWLSETDGFQDEKLCVPMYVDQKIVGVQTISSLPEHDAKRRDEELTVPAFEKLFLYGQRIDHAVKVLGTSKGRKVFVEGFATGLSVRRALHALRQPYMLFITFNAGNLVKVAKAHGEGLVIADHDRPSRQHPNAGGHGKAAAEATGLPYWLSDTEGEDANDYEKRRGTFALSQQLRGLFLRRA